MFGVREAEDRQDRADLRMNTASGAHLPTTEPREIPTLSCRRQKRQRKAERYLGGQACAAYKQHEGDLSRSFSDDAQLPCEEPLLKRRRGECSACHYHLQKLGKAFNDIGRHGKERSKRCKGYPDPKKSNTSTGMLGQKMLGLGKTSLMHTVTTATVITVFSLTSTSILNV